MSHTDTTPTSQDASDDQGAVNTPAQETGTSAAEETPQTPEGAAQQPAEQNEAGETTEAQDGAGAAQAAGAPADPTAVLFQAPDLEAVQPIPAAEVAPVVTAGESEDSEETDGSDPSDSQDRGSDGSDDSDDSGDSRDGGDGSSSSGDEGRRSSRRRRRRGSRGRSRQSDQGGDGSRGAGNGQDDQDDSADQDGRDEQHSSSGGRGGSGGSDGGEVVRKRRRRRRGSVDMEVTGGEGDDPEHTVTRVRAPRETAEAAAPAAPTKVTGLKGSTRLEAKRQRRKNSRDGGRKRQVITEAEFLARRESVDRKMIVRQQGERIQIGVLEDGVLAEHYVSNTQQDSLIGNVYLGKVQNVLPSMEAAFVDIGRGRNAIIYAGEVDWDAANLDGKPRKIENALKSGDSVLVQVTKDPVGHKGARLTSQVSLPGRYLVFVPGGSMTGISRKLPDTERARLKKILKEQMPQNAGVIVRTAAEGASEEELTNDINRLRALWETIQSQAADKKILAPELLYSEPDLTIKVVRDVFNEDFSSMEIQGQETWDNVEAYVTYVAPHLLDRLHQWDAEDQKADDVFAHHRIDEQLAKALDRKVNLPSGGSLVFDRTEAMTVVDVNTGKFTGSGGNLEETVTKNNLEAAEEIVRQLRLRDVGGIIVIDFIDMVLESNRDLVLRRLVECLGRDRTKHQVAEVTSLGLVQMTRKRMGTGLLEVFSTACEHCDGRGLHTHGEPVAQTASYTSDGEMRQGKGSKKRRKGRRGGKGGDGDGGQQPQQKKDDQAGAQQQAQQQAEEKAKQEQARQALAQVAAATAEQSEQSTSADSGRRTDRTSGGQDRQADQSSGQRDGEGRSGRRRSRRPRRAARSGGAPTQAGEAAESAESVSSAAAEASSGDGSGEAPVLTIGGEPVEVPRGERQGRSTDQGGGQESPADVSLDSLDAALESRSQDDSAEESVEKSSGKSTEERTGQQASESTTAAAPAAGPSSSSSTSAAGSDRPARRRRRRAAGSAQGAGGEVHEVSRSVSGPSTTFSASVGSVAASSTPAEESGAEPTMFGVGVSAEKLGQSDSTTAAGTDQTGDEAASGSV
ncbi:Rne/Rng family ribonuclease [Nesterenkonia sp. F]|uniref:Rne/Rng family ribonuclease n=1 Tax=Nesterenkonia sp. F TaxID=795955 RepID=UPI000255CFDE|nr:Rne/Rng family ribonuclease [Nesterenkonia sp. F]